MKTSFIAILLILIISVQSAFSFGKKDQEKNPENKEAAEKSSEVKEDFFKIDLLLDCEKANKNTHFNWSTSSNSHKDAFDAVSGASRDHSTKNMREIFFDKSSKVFLIPKGLYYLNLYAVAGFDSLKNDNFQLLQEEKKLTITFSHRGSDYKIVSNEKGEIEVPDSFFIKFPQKQVEDGKDDEAKSDEKALSQDFTQDRPNEKIKRAYSGILKSEFSQDKILKVKGKLQLKEVEKEKADKKAEIPAAEGQEKPVPGPQA